MESAGGIKPIYPKLFMPMAADLKQAEAEGEKFLREVLGCNTIEEARKLPAQYIEDKYIQCGYFWQAVIDNKFVMDQSYNRVLSDDINDVIMMYGNTTGEFLTVPKEPVEDWVKENFGPCADEYLRLCKEEAGDDPEKLKKAATLCAFDLCAKMSGTVMAKHGRKNYYYVFGPTIPGDDAGAFHSSDLWFEFETLAKCWRPFDGHHYDVARKMCSCWANFAKTGDPNGVDSNGEPLPQWRPFTEEDPCIMYFKDEVYSDNSPIPPKTKLLMDVNLAEYTY